jgi:hypothetical protein
MRALSEKKNPRYGYRRVWALLRREGWYINKKRVHRGCGGRQISEFPQNSAKEGTFRVRARTVAPVGEPSTRTTYGARTTL